MNRLAARIRRRRDARSYADLSAEALQRLRDHAVEHGLDANREHIEYILAARSRRGATNER